MQIGYVIALPVAILAFLVSKPFILCGIPGYYSALGSGLCAWIFFLLIERSPMWASEVRKTCIGVLLFSFLIVRGLAKLPFASLSPIDANSWEEVLGSIGIDNVIGFYIMVSMCMSRHLLWHEKCVERRARLWCGGVDVLIRGLPAYILLGGYKIWSGEVEAGYLLMGSGVWLILITLLSMACSLVYDSIQGVERGDVPEGADTEGNPAWLYLRLLAFFLALLLLTNIVSVRYMWIGPLLATAGLLVYPATFLLTDIVSELYGRKRAEETVIAGLGASVWMGIWIRLLVGLSYDGSLDRTYAAFFSFAPGMIIGSMCAYLAGQWLDVRLFHALKEATGGRYLWLRNNVGTIISQLVDTVVFGFIAWEVWPRLGMAMAVSGSVWSRLVFNECIGKVLFALCDTPFLYLILYLIRRYCKKV